MNAEHILQALMRKEIRPDEAKALLASGKGQTAAAESYTNIDGRRNKPADRTVAGREAIAIVGMSGKYPEADDLPQYWDNLSAGRNSVKEIPRRAGIRATTTIRILKKEKFMPSGWECSKTLRISIRSFSYIADGSGMDGSAAPVVFAGRVQGV